MLLYCPYQLATDTFQHTTTVLLLEILFFSVRPCVSMKRSTPAPIGIIAQSSHTDTTPIGACCHSRVDGAAAWEDDRFSDLAEVDHVLNGRV